MIIPIVIDTRPLIEQYTLSQFEVDTLIDESVKYIAGKFAEYWELAAQQKLRKTRQRYINSIKVIDSGRMHGAVVLDYTQDNVVRFIEEGVGAFDMKAGFERSDKAKRTKKGGWYLTVPFRYATPNAIGESSVFTGKLPASLYKIAKEKEGVPIEIGDVPQKYAVKQIRPPVTNLGLRDSFDEYVHKTNIYQGLAKKRNFDGKSTYMTFRRVSSNSDDLSWIHTGINAYNLADHAMQTLNNNFEFEMSKAIDHALDNMGFD